MANPTATIPQPAISPDDAEPTRWLDQPLPTPKFGDHGYCTIASSVRIAAPPQTCLGVVLHAPGYAPPQGCWNNWVRKIAITAPGADDAAGIPAELTGPDYLSQGARFDMSVVMDQTATSSPRVQSMDVTACEALADGRTGFRVGWTYCMFGLHCERIQEFVDDGQGGTLYATWETFGGVIARIVWMTNAAGIQRGFVEWGRGLKEKAEAMS
ncbi:hypothetical protein MCOR27_002475 [Pyricularia oryzae]|uniref:Uncharacterized protein n=2 Tax=Pyricularia TaxID=48558 RepID=A0ABQ8NR47_PYRGI|nr:hypothetical protein MCOR01_002583 [Pyricularia oryzae]KAI6300945.1 hypothetical protein MCOR33_003427 [Pyricularia grisea]KAH9428806.1 hypothetical protein MCOR02_010229 [Pyricularia oryzae]KAI6255113.1 hypothetical protein MCOR19_008367 [Pyricularia oryzae]KAI6285107.1 hypothetical protein MCOR27_002475 [Pyricularia oryzae]